MTCSEASEAQALLADEIQPLVCSGVMKLLHFAIECLPLQTGQDCSHPDVAADCCCLEWSTGVAEVTND